MREPCRELRGDLFLYAEEELHGPAALRRVERHLDDCADCRELLDRHDRLTGAIVQTGSGSGSAESARRVEAIMDRIRFAPPPEWLVALRAGEAAGRAGAVLPASPPGRIGRGGTAGGRDRRLPTSQEPVESPSREVGPLLVALRSAAPRSARSRRAGGTAHRWRLVAAILVLGSVGGVALLSLSPRWREEGVLARLSTEEPAPVKGVPGGAMALAVAPAAGGGQPEVWWILDEELRSEEDEVRASTSSEFPALLHGFHLSAAPAAVRGGGGGQGGGGQGRDGRGDDPQADSRPSVRAEVYLAGTGVSGPDRFSGPNGLSRPDRPGERLFLVQSGPAADAGTFAAFEICRVLSLEAAAGWEGAPAGFARWRQGAVRRPRLYRVYAGYGARTLPDTGSSLQFLVPAGGPALFPGLGLGPERRQPFPAASTWR